MPTQCIIKNTVFKLLFTGRISPPYTASYYCSKYAAEAFSDSLRLEVKPWDVSVHIIEPSYYKTAITNEENVRRNWQKLWDEQPTEIREEFDEQTFHECKLYITALPSLRPCKISTPSRHQKNISKNSPVKTVQFFSYLDKSLTHWKMITEHLTPL